MAASWWCPLPPTENKDVVKQGDNYRIVFEQESGFVAHDLMRCAVTGGKN